MGGGWDYLLPAKKNQLSELSPARNWSPNMIISPDDSAIIIVVVINIIIIAIVNRHRSTQGPLCERRRFSWYSHSERFFSSLFSSSTGTGYVSLPRPG